MFWAEVWNHIYTGHMVNVRSVVCGSACMHFVCVCVCARVLVCVCTRVCVCE